MTRLPILPIDHPILRRSARPIECFDQALQQLVDGMFATVRAAGGVGLAAPQIGASIQLFVAEYEDDSVALCNPVITSAAGESIGGEGCLSLPGYVGLHIKRAERITVEGQDPRGMRMVVHAEGLFARVLQHEIDHLDGVLFLDYLSDPQDLRPIPTEEVDDSSIRQPVTAGLGT